jgi:transposase
VANRSGTASTDGGNRHANRALHTMVIIRLRLHEPTRSYVERRLADGKTKKEVIRCLKRYAAREIYSTLCRDRAPLPLDSL